MTRVKILGTKDFDTKFKAKGNFQVDLPPSTCPFPLKPKTAKKFDLLIILLICKLLIDKKNCSGLIKVLETTTTVTTTN